MLVWAKLLLVLILAFSPVLECFDKWEQPWYGDSSSELLFSVISCSIALGYAAVRRLIPPRRNLLLLGIVDREFSIPLFVDFASPQTARQAGGVSPFSSAPLRI